MSNAAALRRHVVEPEHGQLEAGGPAVRAHPTEDDRPVGVAIEPDPQLETAALLELHPVDGPAAPRPLANPLRPPLLQRRSVEGRLVEEAQGTS